MGRNYSQASLHSQLHPVSLKQVKFGEGENKSPNALEFNYTGNTSDAIQLDKFYQDLIKNERDQFEKILKTKMNIARSEAAKSLRK